MTEIIYEPEPIESIEARKAYLAEEPARQRKAVEDARRAQYQLISDPLFFGWQRGDNTEAEWLDAVAKIKQELPYPSEVAK
jgi:hypothetical protein